MLFLINITSIKDIVFLVVFAGMCVIILWVNMNPPPQKKSPKIKKRPYIILHLISDLSFKVNTLSEGNNNAV